MSHDTPLPELSTTLSLRSGDQSWGTERRMALLSAIGTEGSISAAARKVGLSYKAAWDAVDMMNNLSGDLLVERTTGGRRGGGARLTGRARELVAWYQAVRAEHQRFMDVLSRLGPDSGRHLGLLHSMALQTSARNRFEGVVQAVASRGINDAVQLRLDGGVVLNATVTHASTERLALEPGRRALAFIKAQAVRILPGAPVDPPRDPEDGNTCWTGRVSHTAAEGGLREVSLEVAPGIRVTGLASETAPGPSDAPARFETGAPAHARFQAADVLIGTLD
jgi:molybdate transport system regulatory protein